MMDYGGYAIPVFRKSSPKVKETLLLYHFALDAFVCGDSCHVTIMETQLVEKLVNGMWMVERELTLQKPPITATPNIPGDNARPGPNLFITTLKSRYASGCDKVIILDDRPQFFGDRNPIQPRRVDIRQYVYISDGPFTSEMNAAYHKMRWRISHMAPGENAAHFDVPLKSLKPTSKTLGDPTGCC